MNPLTIFKLTCLFMLDVSEMLTGWWRVSDIEELRALVNALHSRGIREKCLQRQMQKYLEIIPQVCTKHRDGKSCSWSSYHTFTAYVILESFWASFMI